MGDTLPLIPEKGSLCAEVRPIIRAVFRELDYLPPLTTELPSPVTSDYLTNALNGSHGDQWTEKYKSECKELWLREGELKHQHATRISREPLPNIYRLSSPHTDSPLFRTGSPLGRTESPLTRTGSPHWRLDRGLIARRDLVPSIKQNAGRDASLWIKNILNRSSCDVSALKVVGRSLDQPPLRLLTYETSESIQSISMGEVEKHVPLPPLSPPTSLPHPDYMLCVPPQLDFINFTVGQLHTQDLRLVNVSKYEIRLSVRPPKRRELDVEITSSRGLTVTSGAAAEFRVHFRPCDVRTVRDMLVIRVSIGRNFLVPIACYMQPPILNILIPNMTSIVLSCTPRDATTCMPLTSSDVIELGARLLGDVHSARVLLQCDTDHASFFMLTEDAWFSLSLDCLTTRGSVQAGPFVLWPAWWGGGGAVRGCAWCRAEVAGLHVAELRVVSSTAVMRHLNIVADSLLFGPEHLTIVAQEKDYDICGEGEPACEYYVHLGTAFPHRSLSATVQLINHSSVVYSYYWSVRTWGVCSCLEDESSVGSLGPEDDSERLCVGAKEAQAMARDDPEQYASRGENAQLLRVEPARGQVMPRSACAMHVHVPDVGARLGVQRAVLMLILRDIPKESFPPDYEPMIVRSAEIVSDPIPGVEESIHEVCEIVCAQMEVWWDVVPVRFVLDPPALSLHHSRRVDSLLLDIKATQLFGCEGARVAWGAPARVPLPAPLCLAPAHTRTATLHYPLPSLPNHFPETDIITMEAANEEWRSQCAITRQCATRHPSLQPGRAWLGVVPPATCMHTTFQLFNETYQHICWWAEPFRWWGENQPSPACVGRMPCDTCHERACSCGLLRPARGALHHRARADICYNVNAPECDGCVATLVRARRTDADVALVHGAPGTEARAALLAYRVLAPRLFLRLLPCLHDSNECSGCKVDEGALDSRRGTATLRPRQALTLGRRTCYRLLLTNITPLPTAVHFDRDHDAMDVLKVKFNPNDFKVRPYGQAEIRVVLEARKVCGRRLFVYRGVVESAYKPVYLLVDAAIEGVKISCEVPLGDGFKPDSFVILSRTQKEEFPWEADKPKPSTPEEVFGEEDRKRETVIENLQNVEGVDEIVRTIENLTELEQKDRIITQNQYLEEITSMTENRCRCAFEMVYIPPPPRRPQPPRDNEEHTPIEIVSRPPSLTRVCACMRCSKPLLPQLEQPICLQFTAVPLRTVRTRTLLLRNESVVTVHWSAVVRRWPRKHHRSLDTDQWARDVAAPGVALACAPTGGVLAARAHVALALKVYADCWGLYHDQLLIQIQDVEPIVLDVWVEAVGAPLQLAISSGDRQDGLGVTPIMWMSSSDSERVLRATNASRAPLTVHAYTAVVYEYPQSALPFRLYLRYYDTPPRTCPCLTAFDAELAGLESHSCSIVEEVDTGFDIYLAPDHGVQDATIYTVSPEVVTVGAGAVAEWRVSLAANAQELEVAPDVTLLLRLLPMDNKGPCWQRGEPAAQMVLLRQAPRAPRLQLSCRELCVRLCALHLPYGEVLRVRKRFQVLNVGSGVLKLSMETTAPWCVVCEYTGAGGDEGAVAAGDAGLVTSASACDCDRRVSTRHKRVPLRLEPRSSTEVCVEVCVSAAEAWPAAPGAHVAAPAHCTAPAYPPRSLSTTSLYIFDDDNILKTVPLRLELEFPTLRVSPPQLDFRVVTDGDTRKCYFSVSHSSRTVTLDLATKWIGGKEFKIWPPFLRIAPGGSANVYLQYTAVWQAGPVEGCACVHVCAAGGCGARGAAGEWCRAAVPVRASPARDYKFRVTHHDHTDDPHLLPPAVAPTHE